MNTVPDDAITPDDPPTTKEGWRRFVDYQPEPPTMLTAEQLIALGRRQRAAHDEARRPPRNRHLLHHPARQPATASGSAHPT
jgi:hypothetical protein